MSTRRPDDDFNDRDDDRPRRRRRDDDDDRPRAKPSGGGVGKVLLILLLVGGGLTVLCCGGCGVMLYFAAGKQVMMLDGTRTKNAQGGTATVAVNVRIASDNAGGFIKGDFYFNFQSGSRTSVHSRPLQAFGPGRGPGEYRETFTTPELASETGPVKFWVERRDGDSVFRVSPEYTIP